jgi:phage terminase large subunit-like protein
MAFTPTERVGLIDAVKDPNLLGAMKLWPTQVEMLEAVVWAQRSIWCCGRRSSKSTQASLVLLWMALLQPQLRDHVLADERISFVCVASNREQARIVLNSAKRIVKQSPLLSPLIERETDVAIDFANGSSVEAFVCSARTTRGWPIAALVLDELAWFTSSDEGPQTAANVYKALSPSTLQFGTARRLILSSTPNGPGTFKDYFDAASTAEEAGDKTVAVFQLPSWEVNPTLDQAELDRERAVLGEAFAAEYEAQFLSGATSMLSEGEIRACVGGAGELSPQEGTDWVCGADFAWRRDRSAAVIVGRSHTDSERLIVAAVRTWAPVVAGQYEDVARHQSEVLAEVAQLAQRYHANVFCDTYESAAVSARLQSHGVYVETVPTGAGVKGNMYRELAAKVRLERITLPDHPLLIGDLRRLKVNYRSSGASVENPRAEGGHGDVGAATAMAVFNLSTDSGGSVFGEVGLPARGSVAGDIAYERGELGDGWVSPLDDPGWGPGW